LMVLLREFLLKEEKEFKKNKVKLIVSGKTDQLSSKTQKILEKVMNATDSDSFEIVLNLALNYGGREEIVEATKKIAADVLSKKCRLSEIDEGFFKAYLYSADLPDPDLLIRTGGDMRISNFLLWQIAYTEIHITSVLWPDFSKDELIKAVMDYQKRDRRFGGV
ncbi:di-trans,poly-cis-decaprenylcistransferase, partial [bacterium]|nr:di-trans,poly-cis-decaprenylcistransferase [bacterium]